MEKKLIIFDVDGTVWDSEKDVFLAFNYTLGKKAGFEITKEQFKKLAGMPLGTMFEKVLQNSNKKQVIEFEKEYKKYYIDEEHYIDATTLFKGVKETLDKFNNEGFYMAVASSKPKRILDKMVAKFNLKGFEYVLGTEESNFEHKPNPEIVNYIMEKLKVAKEDAVIVGDSKSDILTGKNAGIDTIAVTYGYDKRENLENAKPTYIIDEFAKLQDIIKLKK